MKELGPEKSDEPTQKCDEN